MTRYEIFKASGTDETIYSLWLGGRLREWAEESGRSQENHDAFDGAHAGSRRRAGSGTSSPPKWLNAKYEKVAR